MASGKNTIVVYRDWGSIFEKLSDDEAGRLIKHFFRYVNDENPESDRLTELVFEPIKQTLKRDLKHWEKVIERRSNAGKISAQKRKEQQMSTHVEENQQMSTHVDFLQHNSTLSTDSVIDIVIDSVTLKSIYKKTPLSKIIISDFPEINEQYFEIAKSFQTLFRNNLIEAGAKTTQIDKATGKWIDDIRLIIENDGYSIDDLRQIYSMLQKDSFWKQNILSTSKLREKMDTLKLKIKNGKNSRNNEKGATWGELAEVLTSAFGS